MVRLVGGSTAQAISESGIHMTHHDLKETESLLSGTEINGSNQVLLLKILQRLRKY